MAWTFSGGSSRREEAEGDTLYVPVHSIALRVTAVADMLVASSVTVAVMLDDPWPAACLAGGSGLGCALSILGRHLSLARDIRRHELQRRLGASDLISALATKGGKQRIVPCLPDARCARSSTMSSRCAPGASSCGGGEDVVSLASPREGRR
jgi:hypothetical protein